MTENERRLIKELEAKGLLPWEPGMMITPSPQFKPGSWWKGKPLIILSSYKHDSYDNIWLYFEGHNSASTSSCTHAPCDALIGWLVEQVPSFFIARNSNDSPVYIEIDSKEAFRQIQGDTLLEALLRAFGGEMGGGA